MKKLTFILSLILLISCSKKEGCIDDVACNFESSAEIDDGSCIYCYQDDCETNPQDLYNCDGICIDMTACNYNDNADNSGCAYAEEYYDCDGVCLSDVDGDLVCDELDTCLNDADNDIDGDGVCGDDEILGCMDETACNFDETATDDEGCEYLIDCADVCGGNAEILTYWYDTDADGLGSGESSEFCNALVEEGWVLNNDDNDDNCLSNVHDCLGICDGDALEDMCGVCDSDPSNDCILDCAGIWGGTHWESDCGCVAVNNTGDDCDDCNGIPNGNSFLDECDICVSDITNVCVPYPNENDLEFLDELILMNAINDSNASFIQSDRVEWEVKNEDEVFNLRIVKLDLANLGLDTIPFSIGGLEHIEWIELENNNITSIPESFGNLTELWKLDLYNNQIMDLPMSIQYLTNLKEFLIYSNKISELDFSFSNLTQLEKFWINNNQIEHIDSSICEIIVNLEFYYNNNKLCENLPTCLMNIDIQDQDCSD